MKLPVGILTGLLSFSSRDKEKGWTCLKSSGATNQDLRNAVDDFSVNYGPGPMFVKAGHCHFSICNNFYFSLCNYGFRNSTEPVGRRKMAKEWGLPGGNGSECAGNFGDEVNYDWYEFGLQSQWHAQKFKIDQFQLRFCGKSVADRNGSSVA